MTELLLSANYINMNKDTLTKDTLNKDTLNKDIIEPILIDNKKRYTLFPIQHNDIWKMAVLAEDLDWKDREIDFSKDYLDWLKFTKDEQLFIKNILAFFAASDGIIIENLASRLMVDVQYPEARAFYAMQVKIEQTHSTTYSKMIDSLILDKDERMHLFNALDTMKSVANKATWSLKWIKNEKNFAKVIIANAVVEGLFFSGAFASIFWIRRKYPGTMKGLIQANELIMRDEGLHYAFAHLIYTNHIIHKLTNDEIKEIIEEAIQIEEQFMMEALPNKLLGMNVDLMIQYIKYIANRLFKMFTNNNLYENIQNPFPWMDQVSLPTVANFFDGRETQYNNSVSGIHGSLDLNDDDVF